MTNWRPDLRGYNCSMGFAPGSKEKKRRPSRVEDANFHEENDTRAYKGGEEKRGVKNGRVGGKEASDSDRALFAFLPNEVFATLPCTCAALPLSLPAQ